MSAEVVLSAKHYLDEAQDRLAKKELVDFISYISSAIALSKNELCDRDTLAKCTYVKAIGLIGFNKYKEALGAIDEALIYNDGDKAVALNKLKGVAKGYLGETKEANKIFTELLNQTTDRDLLVGIYLNLLWVNLTLEKDRSPQQLLKAKNLLDELGNYFEIMSDGRKSAYLQRLSLYHFYMDELEEAIKVLRRSIEFSLEQEMAGIYVNLAEYHFQYYENDLLDDGKEYLKQAESIASKYNDFLVLGHTFFTQAKFDVREGNPFTALDSLYLALAHFKEANAHLQYLECLERINEIEAKCKNEWLTALIDNIKDTSERGTINKMKIKEDVL